MDPNAAPARTLPREDREMFIAANNGHVLAFDNLSNLPPSGVGALQAFDALSGEVHGSVQTTMIDDGGARLRRIDAGLRGHCRCYGQFNDGLCGCEAARRGVWRHCRRRQASPPHSTNTW